MNIWATFKQIAVTTFGNFWKQFGYFSFKHLVTLPPPLMHQYYVSATLLLVYHREIMRAEISWAISSLFGPESGMSCSIKISPFFTPDTLFHSASEQAIYCRGALGRTQRTLTHFVRESITVRLTYCLTGFDSAVLLDWTINRLTCFTSSNPVKPEVSCTVILPLKK